MNVPDYHHTDGTLEAERRIQRARASRATFLDLSPLALRDLPLSLASLSLLRELNIYCNRLTEIPAWISQLKRLRIIHAHGNQLKSLPDSIGLLPHLRVLNVAENRLTELPESLKRLRNLRELYLHDNSLLGLPSEVLGPRAWDVSRSNPPAQPSGILDYYFRIKQGRRALNEAKLILVGRGGVGKTCVINRLIKDSFDDHEPETAGIEIQPWQVVLQDGDTVRLHVWDFGGQEILHATHQFFLTERTLYLLVLSGREGTQTDDAEYWLQLIRSFGGDSRVIIVLNKSGQHPFDVNRGLLLEKYSTVVDFIKTECEDGTGISDLMNGILKQLLVMEHRKADFPADWFAIKERLAGMEENFVTWDQYQNICRRCGENDAEAQRRLAEFLHVLGIALNYRDDPRLKETHVLNPRWVTEGIYTLLRCSQKSHPPAVLAKEDVRNMLEPVHYPLSHHDFLLRLMEKFQLSFRLPGAQERYLVPELLGENQPELKPLLLSPGLKFRYQYQILPEGLLPRFIVQTHLLSDNNPEWRWRTGVVLQRDGCFAIVRADSRERRIDVHVVGPEPQRRGVLAIIREKFDEQHGDLKGLVVDERIPLPQEPDVTVSYRHLVMLEMEGEKWYRPEGTRAKVAVSDLLNGVDEASAQVMRRKGRRADHRLSRVRSQAPMLSIRTVVELDLRGYSDAATELEEHLSPESVLKINQQIQAFIDAALRVVQMEREQAVYETTGDGAILVFEEASTAHRFAIALHEGCRNHNERKSVSRARRWFRIGMATGEVASAQKGKKKTYGGTVIARAVRLEAAAGAGEIVADTNTYVALSQDVQALYSEEEKIRGKRAEVFLAHRCVVVPQSEVEAG